MLLFFRVRRRCKFHIATATAGDAANLASLQDLLHLVRDVFQKKSFTAFLRSRVYRVSLSCRFSMMFPPWRMFA